MTDVQEEQPGQQSQQSHERCVVQNEKKRFMVICLSLLAIVFAFALFLLAKSVFPMFFTIVLTFLCYQRLDFSLSRREKNSKMSSTSTNGEAPKPYTSRAGEHPRSD
ncbi:hypothetical protein Krac_7324 [Ktedonobacter racemifer DSM 44963]|uniref:Transmembrane protein n=1 Tax=Ktedonobacter racemifer DSM 44963 TaxID=485913 RepID=D6TRY4_KTERA|nr:hypothetical protein Krac_7324 [Ktedonobacter racemifer DSM 44963]